MKIVCQILLFIALLMVACGPAERKTAKKSDKETVPPFDPATQQTITYLEIAHIEHFLESNPDIMILDVRGRDDYAKAHIPRAISFPYNPKQKKKKTDERLITFTEHNTKKIHLIYGSKANYYALDVCNRLKVLGYQHLFCIRQDSGIEDWIKSGLPVLSADAVKQP